MIGMDVKDILLVIPTINILHLIFQRTTRKNIFKIYYKHSTFSCKN